MGKKLLNKKSVIKTLKNVRRRQKATTPKAAKASMAKKSRCISEKKGTKKSKRTPSKKASVRRWKTSSVKSGRRSSRKKRKLVTPNKKSAKKRKQIRKNVSLSKKSISKGEKKPQKYKTATRTKGLRRRTKISYDKQKKGTAKRKLVTNGSFSKCKGKTVRNKSLDWKKVVKGKRTLVTKSYERHTPSEMGKIKQIKSSTGEGSNKKQGLTVTHKSVCKNVASQLKTNLTPRICHTNEKSEKFVIQKLYITQLVKKTNSKDQCEVGELDKMKSLQSEKLTQLSPGANIQNDLTQYDSDVTTDLQVQKDKQTSFKVMSKAMEKLNLPTALESVVIDLVSPEEENYQHDSPNSKSLSDFVDNVFPQICLVSPTVSKSAESTKNINNNREKFTYESHLSLSSIAGFWRKSKHDKHSSSATSSIDIPDDPVDMLRHIPERTARNNVKLKKRAIHRSSCTLSSKRSLSISTSGFQKVKRRGI